MSPWLELALLGDAHRSDGRDESYAVQRPRLRRHPHALEFTVSAASTDQWPMPSRAQWQAYTAAHCLLGVPALYYVEGIDTSGERLTHADLVAVARTWARYEAGRTGAAAA